MQSLCGSIGLIRRVRISNSKLVDIKFSSEVAGISNGCSMGYLSRFLRKISTRSPFPSTNCAFQTELLASSNNNGIPLVPLLQRSPRSSSFQCAAVVPTFRSRSMTTMDSSLPQDSSASVTDIAPRIKFKRLDKTAKHIMQILDKEAVQEVRAQREVPDLKPGYIIQLKVVVPENKRRVSSLKGIVIARRNAGLNTTFRLRRLVAGVGVESLFPLYSPNIKEIKVLDKKKVRRAKLYYLRDKMNALKKQ